ncbi:MAG: ATP-dependent DNA helicase RecG [Gammaproteobacteria bacterium]|nr:MAG: ATP-dependent DNA helicase RecG [Gammaproteobacteria bacterium]
MNSFWQSTPVSQLKGVGASTAQKLHRLGLKNLQDLLFHLPSRYQDRTRITPIGATRAFNEALIQGTVEISEVVFRKRRSLVCRVADGSGAIQLRFFHFSAAQQQQLSKGALIRCFGEVRITGFGKEMVHPEYQLLKAADAPVEQVLTPIYPTTEGVSQNLLRKLTDQAIRLLDGAHPIKELIPEAVIAEHHWPTLATALKLTHRPSPEANVTQLLQGTHPAQRRLALEELLAHHVSLLGVRQTIKQTTAPALQPTQSRAAQFLGQLPFTPTQAQQRVAAEINQDLSQAHPMLRLVQGDVGSGKTLVAALAALQAIDCGYQVALMAPTEILAEQHYQTFSEWFDALAISTGWLSGKTKGKARASKLVDIESGQFPMVIGTHALFQEDVHYHNLGLVIIDEQHRFGVHQRLQLKDKGAASGITPHQLIMTATPIPRTLAMSAYADLDTSVIDELPPGRKPVTTVVIDNQRRAQVIQRVQNACNEGRQVYWVCTLIEESEALQCQAAEDAARLLSEQLPGIAVGLVHGRMKPQEKSAVMDAFQSGALQLLVATTVIEVGVNVPNASVMVIENPERLGLAQLHQLRGRVGRGSDASFCVLLYQTPLSQQGKARLEIMRATQDGFEIAERDLQLRGPGEVLGTRQTGDIGFKIADLMRDEDLLETLKPIAWQILTHHQPLVEPLINRWLGNNKAYAQV